MTFDIHPIPRLEWTLLPNIGWLNVDAISLFRSEQSNNAQQLFARQDTIHEHPYVICLEGDGFICLGGTAASIFSGE